MCSVTATAGREAGAAPPEPLYPARTVMIDPELLEILVCPETREPVRPADEALLQRINAAIEAGRVTNRGGDPVESPLDEALVREDGRILYPVRDGIPVMLVDEAIELDGPAGGAGPNGTD